MSTRTVTKAEVSQLSTMVFRAILHDGSATMSIADRRVDRNAYDVRTPAPKKGTAKHCVNAIAKRTGESPYEVASRLHVPLNFHESKDGALVVTKDSYALLPARGDLRAEWMALGTA